MAIKVRAINPGYYGSYREAGHEFHIKEEEHFSKKWMQKTEPEAKGNRKGKPQKEAEPESTEESEPEADSEVI